MKKLLVALAILISTIFAVRASIPVAPLDGQVLAVQTGTTFQGIRSALQAQPGTFIMMKDQLTIFVWSVADGWAFTALDGKARASAIVADQIVKGGNFVNCKTIDELMKFLAAAGWSRAMPEQVPQVIWQGAIEVGGWLKALSMNLTTFVFVPANAGADYLESMGIVGQIDS